MAYLLGITPVDLHRLITCSLSDSSASEKNRARTRTIDLDFDRDRRDEVIAYVYQRYGREHTALVCNVVTYGYAVGRARHRTGARFPG